VIDLTIEPLTVDAFRPFGEVIDKRTAKQIGINYGLTTRYHDLAHVDAGGEDARVLINIFRTAPLPLPHHVRVMERHPLGSQAFIPLGSTRFYVLTATGAHRPDPHTFRLFITDGYQGVNYSRNTWHHFQIVIDHVAEFIVIDRGGAGANLDEVNVEDLGIRVPRPG
jgi:ureidoglycolate lyase